MPPYKVFLWTSAILWLIVYILVLYRAFRDRTYAMPFIAMCCNVVWEFFFGFVYQIYSSPADRVWFVLDLVIIYTYFKFWRTDYPEHLLPRWRWPRFVIACAAAAGILVVMVQHLGAGIGNLHFAFADNLVMSISFVGMLVRRGGAKGQSLGIAWSKLFGTQTAAIATYLQGNSDVVFNAIYVEILFFDLLYILMLWKPSLWRDPQRSVDA